MDHYTRALRNTFVSNEIDRLHEFRRNPIWIENALYQPETRFYILVNEDILISKQPPYPLALLPRQATQFIKNASAIILLGKAHNFLYFALLFDTAPDFGRIHGKLSDLRELSPGLTAVESALLAQSTGMAAWHRHNQFCSVCGSQTTNAEAGYTRKCTNPACGRLHFPRTDPAIIVRTTYQNSCLLGRQAQWPQGRYSNIAGF
ncbi:MAG: NADH pyrophosphatase zinc ribbon domain-containing protein, partial [Anaerolineae bacterium]|nr:NADH pyrophosphatase zinc ribbon domain-containing protein [Anaerolineae bacterium]